MSYYFAKTLALGFDEAVRRRSGLICPCRQVWCDLAIHKPFDQPCRAINGVACKPLGPQIEAALDAVHHGLGDSDLDCAIGQIRSRTPARTRRPAS